MQLSLLRLSGWQMSSISPGFTPNCSINVWTSVVAKTHRLPT